MDTKKAYAEMIEFAIECGGPMSHNNLPANWSIRAVKNGSGSDNYLVSLCGVTYIVWDNGGEVGVEEINSGDLARFFPLTWWDTVLDAGTLYMRLISVLRDEEIDFDYRADLSVDDFRKAKDAN